MFARLATFRAPCQFSPRGNVESPLNDLGGLDIIDPNSMNTELPLTQDMFDKLLEWLDEDREEAGKKYEVIRRRLIKIFICRGAHEAEELADDTINRVTRKAPEIILTYTGDPVAYFHGVAHNVFREWLRRKAAMIAPPELLEEAGNDIEREYACFEQCMHRLPDGNRTLVLEYYQAERQAKIDHRKELADRLGIALNALRIRAHRIRTKLAECVQSCLGQTPEK
jgi:RNA polymerase sigma factor (sigma-70 family)